MTREYTYNLRVRSYECDSLGHVNNAVYQQYLEEAAVSASSDVGFGLAWYRARGEAWVVRDMTLEYLYPAIAGDELSVTTWISTIGRVRGNREYEIRRLGGPDSNFHFGAEDHAGRHALASDDSAVDPANESAPDHPGQIIARGTANWVYVNVETGRPTPFPKESVPAFDPNGKSVTKPLALPAKGISAATYRWEHDIRHYELDSNNHVNNAIYLHWLEEAKYRAVIEVGWPPERMLEHGFSIVQIRHDTHYLLPAFYPGTVEITSRFYELRHASGTWEHEIRRASTGELLLRNYSTGTYLGPNRRPVRPPKEFIEALLVGPAPSDKANGSDEGIRAAGQTETAGC